MFFFYLNFFNNININSIFQIRKVMVSPEFSVSRHFHVTFGTNYKAFGFGKDT